MGLGLWQAQRQLVIPPAVNLPVSGTSLLSVWNLQYSGTGPRNFSNGVWPSGITAGAGGTTTGIPTYLVNKGFVWSNHDSNIYLDVTTTSVSVDGYDFSLCAGVTVNGTTGTITLNDCALPKNVATASFFGRAFAAPCDINGNLQTTALTVTMNYCSFYRAMFQPGGTATSWTQYRCKYEYLDQGICSSADNSILFDECYMPGIGCNPAPNAHVENVQWNGLVTKTLTLRKCMIDTAAQGQASLGVTSPNYGWTGVYSGNAGTGAWALLDTIIVGLGRVNANPSNPNRINTCLWYKNLQTVSVTNCVLEAGVYGQGYTANGDSGASRPTDGGGNRSIGNSALTSTNFN